MFNNLVIFGLLARILGLGSFGLISYLIALISLVATVSDFGFRMIIVKEVAVNPSIVNANYISSKLSIIAAAFISAFVLLSIYLYPKDLNIPFIFVLLFCFNSFFHALSNFLLGFFHAINKFHLETWTLVVFTLSLIIGLYLTYVHTQMRWFLLFYSVGSILMFLVCIYFFLSNYAKKEVSKFELPKLYKLIKDLPHIVPFAIIVIADIFFNTIDTLLVEALVPKPDLGIYVASMKIALGIGLFSIIAYSALFPIISKMNASATQSSNKQLFQYFVILLGLGLIVPVLYVSFDQFVIDVFLGKNFGRTSTYSVNMFSLDIAIYTFSRHALVIPAIMLIVKGLEFKRVYLLVSVLIISTIFYYLLIPKYGLKIAFRICSIANLTLFFLYLITALFYIIPEHRKLKLL